MAADKGTGTRTVTDATFDADVLKATGPVVVDFWAEWCGPCKAIGPTLEQLAGEMAGQVTIAKMNVDENMRTPGQFGIRAIPTLMIFKGGKVVATHQGSAPKKKLEDWIKAAVEA